MSILTTREAARKKSNNTNNPNKNICTYAVTEALGCGSETRYLHTIKDVVYALRKQYTVRSRGSKVKGKSVGKARKICEKLADEVKYGKVNFLVQVEGHVLLLNRHGKTIVDTDSRKRDARKIKSFYIVYR